MQEVAVAHVIAPQLPIRKTQLDARNAAEFVMQQFQGCTSLCSISRKELTVFDIRTFQVCWFDIFPHHTAWKPSFADELFGPFSLLHGTEGKLHCKPSAEPRPTFQWFRNGVLISYGVNSRHILQQDGTLVIKKVDKDKDSVNYTCKAQNMMGQDSATTVPVVLGKRSSSYTQAKFRRGRNSLR